ncbi:hypothetical protein F993_01483 [Acinetobacter proteolyticus]|uniref:Uncharacterized protein n=1 Tax=Acinetobacter proteolyticus TaxID=1776741 RepID=A0ABN0JG08_9GAMM|nr:hypothetical protein F993_01483 [Acinetobacter proteolyticus]
MIEGESEVLHVNCKRSTPNLILSVITLHLFE